MRVGGAAAVTIDFVARRTRHSARLLGEIRAFSRIQEPRRVEPDRYQGELVIVGVGSGPVDITLTVTPP